MYSDAEGNGSVAAVAIKGDVRIFMRGWIPQYLRRCLKKRKTNIVGYELIVAVGAMVSFCPELVQNSIADHYVDSQSAISCILKGSSPQDDLCAIAG